MPFVIPKNSENFFIDNLWPTGVVPSRVVFGFVKEKAYRGDRNLNPYNFARQFVANSSPNELVDVTEVNLSLNGVSVDGLQDNGYCLELDYLKSFEYTGLRAAGISNHITLKRFKGGSYFSVWDLTAGLNGSDVFCNPAIRTGQLRLSVKFSGSTGENIVLLAYSEYPST